ncbi:hypothetical protein OHC33_007460 [Knufia fluminis]|uniref:Uncharacterized protein n=1 Tax=Knufia fluminis TaxID=191047 RepID=A0AAN8EBF8_9EURO|nr:hypothetical protein OHC33_007460 [Knufia fluminis]
MLQRPTTPANNSPALLAASQAFTGSQGPQTKLATGAAAAALRSMSPASTPVNQVQTRRMMDRQSSVGSQQNAARGRSRGGNNMVRRNSSSSMTERNFRAQSPGRPSASNGIPESRQNEPPVPPMPQGYSDIPPIPKKSHRRSASIDDIQIRKNAGRQPVDGNSFATAPSSKPAANPASAAAKRVTSGQMTPQLDRADSQNSVNFSYPGRSRPTSPPPQNSPVQQASRQQLPPGAPRGISGTDARNIQHDLTQTAQQPVKKKKKREGPLSEGSHLQTGTMGHKPVLTPLATGPQQQDAQSFEDEGRGQNNAKLTGQASHFPTSPVSPTDSRGSDSDGDQRTKTRRVQRASGALTKQPSVVREDWEGEQEDTPSSPVEVSPIPARLAPSKRQNAEANVSRKIEGNATTNRQDQEQAETPSPSQNLVVTPQMRKPSLSPSRSTRFSNRLSSDMAEGQKHEPPARSVSPRKSALKLSNSPHIRPIDTQRGRDPSLTPSDTTDLSADGAPRRKKNAHVNFDNQLAVVGVAAEVDSPSTPQIISPQHKDTDKKWFGKKPNRVVLSEDSDDEYAMKPQPQLPTFGSIRNGRRNEVESSPNQQVFSSPSSSLTSSNSADTRPTTMDASVSSDHAIGGILLRDNEQKRAVGQTPLPPEVTSVEGTGLHSDTESTYSQDNDNFVEPPVRQFSAYHQATSHPLRAVENAAEVPTIALQPATPGAEEEPKHHDQWLVEVPGGFPSSSGEAFVTARSREGTAPELAQPEPTSSTSADEPWQASTQTHSDKMPAIQEEDSDRDSIYSDAEEEISDTEGDGFGSINAIVTSPAVASPTARSTPSESPIYAAPQRNIERESERGTADWDDVGARWKDYRENVARASLQPAPAMVEGEAHEPTQTVAANANPASRKKPAASPPAPAAGPAVTSIQSSTPSGAARAARASAQPGFKKSMRSEAETPAATMRARAGSNHNEPKAMRSSVRSSAGPTQYNEAPKPMKSSMRHSAAPAARAVVANPQPQVQGTLQKKNLRSSAPPPARTALPPVAGDSDSDSSFRKRRRAKANDGGKYSMRRSMRAGSESGPSAQERNAVRSLSPVERRAFSPVGGQSSMRTTLRGSIDNTPTLRGNQKNDKRSSSLFGRKREAKSPTRPMSVAGFGKSRIAESDDEGDTRPRKSYKSRFGDSSDEEDDLPPVRGIPRKNKDDDSTDLEDSSDEDRKKTKKATPAKNISIAVPSSPRVSERPTSPVSPGEKKKRGFFGRMRKGKDETVSPVSKESQPAVNGSTDVTSVVPHNAAAAAPAMGPEAQKEALIEQARKKLEASGEISKSTRPTSPSPGKLQRRMTPSRGMSDSWPLPPKIPEDTQTVDRPFTSDGSTPRPPIGDRQTSTATATSPIGSGEADGKGGKKKRFPLLRKAFGLKD